LGNTVSDVDFDPLEAILEHSEGLALAAENNFDAAVAHCPQWSVADLVWHVSDVHWFWATIVEERLGAPPDESRRPARVRDDRLLAHFRAGAHHLVDVLERAPDDAGVWTWAPAQHDVAFVTRHQVQEAAVHHWDAANAAGEDIEIAFPIASDAVDEFLTFSVASADDTADPAPAPIAGAFVIATSDGGYSWTIEDGPESGTLLVRNGASDGLPTVRARAADLLLWLYRRVAIEVPTSAAPLIERFRAFTFTD
jgi:uncharacterized protein (TIGR03083 family)